MAVVNHEQFDRPGIQQKLWQNQFYGWSAGNLAESTTTIGRAIVVIQVEYRLSGTDSNTYLKPQIIIAIQFQSLISLITKLKANEQIHLGMGSFRKVFFGDEAVDEAVFKKT